MCPVGVWGTRLNNESVKNVWGRSPHTIFTFLLRNLCPQTSCGHNFCGVCIYWSAQACPQPAPHCFILSQFGAQIPAVGAERYGGGYGFLATPTRRGRPMLRNSACGPEIGFPGRKLGFRAGFRPDSNREDIRIGPPAGRRLAGGPILRLSRLEFNRHPAWKPD